MEATKKSDKINDNDKGAKKLKISEAIVVEGRDDVDAVSKACEALIIATHGFGITKATWNLLEKAYQEKGLIILTDPDYSGEEIRRRLNERFPNALHAYVPRCEATKAEDVGIENAEPSAIRTALVKVQGKRSLKSDEGMTMQDMSDLGLVGQPCSAAARELVGAELGIGYGNGKAFLRKLNGFGIEKAEIIKMVEKIGK